MAPGLGSARSGAFAAAMGVSALVDRLGDDTPDTLRVFDEASQEDVTERRVDQCRDVGIGFRLGLAASGSALASGLRRGFGFRFGRSFGFGRGFGLGFRLRLSLGV